MAGSEGGSDWTGSAGDGEGEAEDGAESGGIGEAAGVERGECEWLIERGGLREMDAGIDESAWCNVGGGGS